MGSGEVGYDSQSVIRWKRLCIVQCQADRGVIILGKCSQMGVAVFVLGSRCSLHIHSLKRDLTAHGRRLYFPLWTSGWQKSPWCWGWKVSGSRGLCQNQQLQGWAFWMGTLVFWHGVRQSPVGMWAGILLIHISGDWCQSMCAVCAVCGVVCAAVAVVCEVCALQKLLDVHAVWCGDSWPFLWTVEEAFFPW